MRTGMNLLLWTGHVTSEHYPLFAKLKQTGFDGVELDAPSKYSSDEAKKCIAETGLKVLPDAPIRMRDEKYSFLKIVFDPSVQINDPPGQGYLFEPTVPAKVVTQEDVSPLVPNEIVATLASGHSVGNDRRNQCEAARSCGSARCRCTAPGIRADA